MEDHVLSVRSLSVEFLGKTANNKVVHELSFNISAGETLAIVGESGSGKSVSSLSILQLLNPETSLVSGDIVLKHNKTMVNLLDLDEAAMSKLRGQAIAMIFQEPMAALNPVLKCGEQVAEIIAVHDRGLSKSALKERVLHLFREVELPRPEEMFGNYPYQLSGGQQQRVMIAMALANEPALLIADEPTTALDPVVQDEILELIKQLQRKHNMAMLFISHDLDAVKKVADHVVVMQMGEVKESGPAKTLFANPQHPYTRGLLSSKPGEDKKGSILPTVADFIRDPQFKPSSLPPKELGAEIIALENVSVIYKTGGFLKKSSEVIAIKDVTIRLRKGETVGVIGPSGCGKTTTGRVLAGWIPPTSGEVVYNGVPMITPAESPGKSWAREVQLIFQDPFGSLNPKIKIGEAIAEPMLVHQLAGSSKEAREKVCWLLEKVGLKAEHYDRYPHEFSGGQRQRIVIARALAVQPKVLVCDESVAALDVSVQAQVLNLLNSLQRELGLTYLFISHDHNVIGYFCDRIIEMEMGSVKIQNAAPIATLHEKVQEPIPVQVYEPIAEPVAPPKEEPLAITATDDSKPIWQQFLEETPSIAETHKTDEPTIAETIVDSEPVEELQDFNPHFNPDDDIADHISADLLRIRLAKEHRDMELLAADLHLPVVDDSIDELLPEPAVKITESTAEVISDEGIQQISENSIEPVPAPAMTSDNEITESPLEMPEEDTPTKAAENNQLSSATENKRSYSKLSDFIKGNSPK